ncbi:MAG: NERD domain-containing protein [Dysgonamonadaceae bacterium]|nr:NERD domain-containing protein [Dysgonamonadaceae bacterium]MDD4727236.1 NERD domain-containing protein [Dysgonamonadaceae bacterium]
MGIFAIIVTALVFVYSINRHRNNEKRNARKISRQLNKLHANEYKTLNKKRVKSPIGSSQIDYIVISIYGIFIIESKNYAGQIDGEENSKYWTYTKFKKKIKFKNPIKNNQEHIDALKVALSDYTQIIYHPIVVFTSNAKINSITSSTPVIYSNQLFLTIMAKRETPNLNIEQVNNITAKINEGIISEKKKIRAFKDQKSIRAQKRKDKSLICPRCGNDLIVKEGPYGKFYGCSNYPKCRCTVTYRG